MRVAAKRDKSRTQLVAVEYYNVRNLKSAVKWEVNTHSMWN